jgi:hypothetical protein
MEEAKQSTAEVEVPESFPKRVAASGLAGTQPKLSVVEFEGCYYTLGNTPPERHARYLWCLDLARQFVEASRNTKLGKRKDVAEEEILQQYHDRLLQAAWGVEPNEAAWIFTEVARQLNWPRPGRMASI